MTAVIDQLDVDQVNRELEVCDSPRDIIEWTLENFPDHTFTTTSFQVSGMVLLHMLKDIAPKTPVLFIDTKFHFPETIAFKDKVISDWGLNVVELSRDMSDDEFFGAYGDKPYEKDPEVCCLINKVQPLQYALENNDAYKCWLVGLRRDQSKRRGKLRIVESEGGIVKVHPLANWTRDTIEYYLEKNNVPRNPLFDQGFLSLGCAPEVCTRPPRHNKPGQNERTQRWSGKMKDECGIHTFLESKEKAAEGKSASI